MGVIVPNPTVETEDGSVSVKNVKKIEVTDGDLTDDGGRIVSIDTSGEGATPATPADAVQYNSDPAGSFTATSNFTYDATDGVVSSIGAKLGDLFVGNNGEGVGNAQIESAEASGDGHITISPREDGFLFVQNDNAAGTGRENCYVNLINGNASGVPLVDDKVTRVRLTELTGERMTELLHEYDDPNTNFKVKVFESNNNPTNCYISTYDGKTYVTTHETNGDAELRVKSDGTGIPKLGLESGSDAIELHCDDNKKLKVYSSAANFVLDCTTTSGGITFPDGTTQTTAASAGAAAIKTMPSWQPDPDETGDSYYMPLYPFTTNVGGSSMSLGSAINKPSYYPIFIGDNTQIDKLMIKCASDSSDAGSPVVKAAIYTAYTLEDYNDDNNTVIGTPKAKVANSDAEFAVDNSVASERRVYTYGTTVELTANTWYLIGIVGGQAFTSYPGIRRNGSQSLQYTSDVNYGGWQNSSDTDYTLPASYSVGTPGDWDPSSAFFYCPYVGYRSPDVAT